MDTIVNRTFPSLDLLSYRSSVLFQLLKRSAPEIAAVMRPIGILSQSAFGWLAALMLHQALFSLRRANHRLSQPVRNVACRCAERSEIERD